MSHSFFAYIFRMRYIARWALMRNTRTENVEEHSYGWQCWPTPCLSLAGTCFKRT